MRAPLSGLAEGPDAVLFSRRVVAIDPPGVFFATAIANAPTSICTRWGRPVGGGIARDEALASTKAVAEALERRAAFGQPRASLQYGARAHIVRPTIPAGFPAVDERTALWWCAAQSRAWPFAAPAMHETKTFHLPLERLQLGCPSASTGYVADTSGIAAHTDAEQGWRGAVIEVVERAGLRRLWTARVHALLSRAAFPPSVDPIVSQCAQRGYEFCAAIDRPHPAVAVAAVLLIRRDLDRAPALVCGAGAGTSIADALAHGAREAFGQLIQAQDAEPLRDGEPLRNHYDHLRYYLDPARARAMLRDWGVLDAPRSGEIGRIPWSAPAVRDDALLLAIDRTDDTCDEVGLTVSQAVVPALRPIHAASDTARGWAVPFG